MAKNIKNLQELDNELESGKVVVDFYADWCGPCKMMEPHFKAVSEKIKGITFVKVDVDNAKDIADKYSIMSIPTIMIFENKAVVKKHTGFLNQEGLESLIK